MSNSDSMHRPAPEFRQHLEWEIVRTYRRERRLHAGRRRRALRWARAAAVVCVSVAIGATAGIAPAQIRENARRDSLLQSARADADLASLRLQLAREKLADVKRKVDVGALAQPSLADAETELRAMEAQAVRARLNIEEIRASAQPPRDDLNAPLVNGRDFVTDRVRLDLLSAQQRLTAAEAAQADAERRASVGAASELAGADAAVEAARARATLGVLAKRLELRREFVQKGTPVDQLERRLEEARLRLEASASRQALDAARARLSFLEKRLAVGATEELEVMKARVSVKELELELRSLAQRLRGGAVRD